MGVCRFLATFSVILMLALTTVEVTFASAPCARGFEKLALKKNPQLAIWELEAAGRHEAANRLRAKVEESMRTAKIINPSPTLGRPDEAQFVIIEFANGRKGVAKTWDIDDEYGDSPTKREVFGELFAYQFDRATRANIVPVTVERKIKGQTYIIQLFVHDTDGVSLVPDPHTLKLFDFLSAQTDRIAENHMTVRGRTVAIDNADAFDRTNEINSIPQFDRYIDTVLAKVSSSADPAARASAANEIAPSLISREFVEKLKTLSDLQWAEAMPKLSKADLKKFLERKNRAVQAIQRAETMLGDAIYPAGRFSGLVRTSNTSKQDELESFLKKYGRQISSHSRVVIQNAIDKIGRANLGGRAFMSPEDVADIEAAYGQIQLFNRKMGYDPANER